jgi:hypothetical protein
MQLLTLTFWKNVWAWSKINWKFLVGFALPCIVLYFFNQRKAQNILRKGIELRKKQLDVTQRAADLESAGIKKNAAEFVNRVEEVTTRHEEALRKLDSDNQAQHEKLGGSDVTDITEAIADRFGLDNGDKNE